MREQREVLEHQADIAPFRRQEARAARHFAVVDQNAAFARLLDAGGEPQQRGLAAAGASEQADDLAGLDIEREIAHGDDIAVAMGDAIVGESGRDGGRHAPAFGGRMRGNTRYNAAGHLLLGRLRARRKTEIEVARLQRVFVLAQAPDRRTGIGTEKFGGRWPSSMPEPFSSSRPGRSLN